MSQSFVSDLISGKQSPHRVSRNLKNILPVPTTDHLSSTTFWVSEKVKRQKYLSCPLPGEISISSFFHSCLYTCTDDQTLQTYGNHQKLKHMYCGKADG